MQRSGEVVCQPGKSVMKKILVLILLAAMISCHKDNTPPISGKWELRKATGGIAPYIAYAPGTGNIWQFNNDNTYTFFSNTGTAYQNGTYSVQRSGNNNEYKLQLKSASSTSTIKIQLNGNELLQIPEETCCDMQTLFFVRL